MLHLNQSKQRRKKHPQKNHLQKPLHQRRGKAGELLAKRHLQSNGYTILELNWHTRWAEIDIVAIDGDTLVCVEVKTRYSHERGTPEESITPQKIATLSRSIELYKSEHPELPDALRIDFVGIDYAGGGPPRTNLIKNISE